MAKRRRKKLTKAEAGRMGGKATVRKYGTEHMRSIGKAGFAAFAASSDSWAGGRGASAGSTATGNCPSAATTRIRCSRSSGHSRARRRDRIGRAPVMTNPERKESPQGGGAQAARTRAGEAGGGRPQGVRGALRAGDPGPHRALGIHRRPQDLPLGSRAEGEPSPQGLAVDGPSGPPRRPRSVGGEAPMIVRHEQFNARGEASRTRVDLNALVPSSTGPPWASRCCARLRAAGEIPGLDALDLERDLIAGLAGSPVGPDPSKRRVPCDRTRR